MIDRRLNILVLSDIHWKVDYSNYSDESNTAIKSFVESFHDQLKVRTFDFILLVGDISHEGEKKQFENFKINILDPLIMDFKIPVLATPGNHDIDRSIINGNNDFLKDFLKSVTIKEIQSNAFSGSRHFREVFFEEHLSNFNDVFKSYIEFFNSIKETRDKYLIYNPTYDQHGLFGYVLDARSKTIFLILNTAWYSFSRLFLEYYIENECSLEIDKLKKIKQPSKEYDKCLHEVSKNISLIADEYGKLITGIDMLNQSEDIINILKKHPDYLIITLMHHPINWLIKNDQLPQKQFKLKKILQDTDLLITGHEHVVVSHPVKYLNNGNTAHIDSGLLINENGSIEDCWFSTLEINIKKRTLWQERMLYSPKSGKWGRACAQFIKLNKKHFSILSKKRRIEIEQTIDKFPLKILENIFDKSGFIKHTVYFKRRDCMFFLLKSNEINTEVLWLLNEIKSTNTKKVFFIWFDIFSNLADDYYKTKINRLLTLDKIKHQFDFMFDSYRYNFFSGLDESNSIMLSQVMFISKIIPFWEIEHLIIFKN